MKNRHWDIFVANDGGRLVRLCYTNASGNFEAMEVAEFVTWNGAADQKAAEDFMLDTLNRAEQIAKQVALSALKNEASNFKETP